MAPKKASMGTTSKECLNWTKCMDDALVDAFMHQHNEGNKVNGTFTSTAYDNIVKELSALFGKKVDKEKIKNRWKTLKKNFYEVYDVFKNDMSGFAWNPSTSLWDAEDQVWDALIESKPRAAIWRNTPVPNYEKMVILYGNDRATGEGSATASELRKRRLSTSEEDFHDTINHVDNLVSQNDVTLENYENYVDVDNLSVHEQSHGDTSATSKRKRREVETKEKDIDKLVNVMDKVASILSVGNDVVQCGNSILQEALIPKDLMSGEDIWKMITDCGYDPDKLPAIYNSLIRDKEKQKSVLQCPPAMRKAIIMDLVFGSFK